MVRAVMRAASYAPTYFVFYGFTVGPEVVRAR
jgi:hypothetical protein